MTRAGTIGILGGGQLGRMLALAGYPLALQFRFLDRSADGPAAQVGEVVVGAADDQPALARFADGLSLVTYEFENVPVDAALFLEQRVPVRPPPAALEASQDRLNEKALCRSLGLANPTFLPIDTKAELSAAVHQLGLPAVLKTRRFGYDGKGQYVLQKVPDLDDAWDNLGGVPLLLEQFVPFERELSLIAVRALGGETAFYPLVENHHREGILRLSKAPAPRSATLQPQAEYCVRRIMEALNYVGVLTVEFFQVGDRLLVNELAPRVHNSGHWTIEGACTSQFENHFRAILGLPLGRTEVRGPSAMVNIIGTIPETKAVLAVPGAHLHLYGKEPRPGRKLGHITLCESNDLLLAQRLEVLKKVAGTNVASTIS